MKRQCTGDLSCQLPGIRRLEHLQHLPVVRVRGMGVGREHPLVVVGNVEARRQARGEEVLREEHRALGRPVGRVVMDRLEPRVEQVEHAVGVACAATNRGSSA